jgi:hypothetical protein
VGSKTYTLGGNSPASAIPASTMTLTTNPPTSSITDTLNINFATASTVAVNATLTMTFIPSVAGVGDDPTVAFASGGRTITVNLAIGGTQATYSGSPNIGVNTGNTAGQIVFTLTFPSQTPTTKSFTVAPAPIAITSTDATWASPNIVVTIHGVDNTYSASTVVFTFTYTDGTVASPITYDATSSFHNYFFGPSNTSGGQFSLVASFPVSGPVTDVASVTYVMTNSQGTSSGGAAFH